MKSLNDSLREEFNSVLNEQEFKDKIKRNDLDISILNKAFDVLLKFKSNPDLTDKARGEFENYLINYFKTLKNLR